MFLVLASQFDSFFHEIDGLKSDIINQLLNNNGATQ